MALKAVDQALRLHVPNAHHVVVRTHAEDQTVRMELDAGEAAGRLVIRHPLEARPRLQRVERPRRVHAHRGRVRAGRVHAHAGHLGCVRGDRRALSVALARLGPDLGRLVGRSGEDDVAARIGVELDRGELFGVALQLGHNLVRRVVEHDGALVEPASKGDGLVSRVHVDARDTLLDRRVRRGRALLTVLANVRLRRQPLRSWALLAPLRQLFAQSGELANDGLGDLGRCGTALNVHGVRRLARRLRRRRLRHLPLPL
mmetsp:Transcript_13773/g.29072  ORF Transcript_13773/g.29072 Transcript_13773/m.29072 type:complete len:258 (+) Transcript_13773:526-1299(+)